MLFKKRQPNPNVVVGKKEKLSTRLRKRLKSTTGKQRILLVIAGFAIIALVVIGVYAYGNMIERKILTENEFEDVVVDQEKINETAEEIRNNPDGIPSEAFSLPVPEDEAQRKVKEDLENNFIGIGTQE